MFRKFQTVLEMLKNVFRKSHAGKTMAKMTHFRAMQEKQWLKWIILGPCKKNNGKNDSF